MRPAAATRESVSVDFPVMRHPISFNCTPCDERNRMRLTVIDVCNHRDVPDIVLLVYENRVDEPELVLISSYTTIESVSAVAGCCHATPQHPPMRAWISSIVKLGILDSLRGKIELGSAERI